ncbi:MAG: hypothetical protein IJD22_00945 [Clostridia bacterium]|nr:hypothetical protein [Clostridia bacterium]
MICPNCQKETPVEQGTCVYCGAVLNSTNEPAPAMPTQKKKGGALKAIIPIIIAIVIIIVINVLTAGPTGTAVLEYDEVENGVKGHTVQTFNYKNDIVTDFTERIEMTPPEGTDADAFADFCEEYVEKEYKGFEEAGFITVEYGVEDDKFVLTIKYTNLDNEANVDKMEELGLTDGELDLISYEATRDNLVAQGYKVVSED